MNLKVWLGQEKNTAVKALFSLWSLKKRKLGFIGKVKKEKILNKDMLIVTFK